MTNSPTISRDAYIDVAKGLAIIAIVFGHVWRGLYAADLIENNSLYVAVDTTVYMSHLTVFAFTAGLFVQRGMQRQGAWRYALNRDTHFLWLYLLWSALQGLVKIAAAQLVNSPISLLDVVQVWIPDGQLWFFGWIGVMLVLTAATRPWVSTSRSFVVLSLVTAGSLITWGWNGTVIGTQGLALSTYFFIGVLWRGDRALRVAASSSIATQLVVALLGLGSMVALSLSGSATPPTTSAGNTDAYSVLLGLIGSTAGLAGVLAVSALISKTRGSEVIALLGRKSLVIFVAHIVFASGCRILLTRLGLENLYLQALIGTVAGITGPLVLNAIAERAHGQWLFGLPQPIARAIAPLGG